MFRLSNLVTTLFGILAALAAWAGIRDIANPNGTLSNNATDSDGVVMKTLPGDLTFGALQPGTTQSGDGTSIESLTRAQRLTRQIGQTAMNLAQRANSRNEPASPSDPGPVAQNPSADFVVQGDGVELTVEPATPTVPSEATAVELDPSPSGASPAPTPSAPTASAPAPAPAPSTAPVARAPQPPVKAMW